MKAAGFEWVLPAKTDQPAPIPCEMIEVKLQRVRRSDAAALCKHLRVAGDHRIDSFCEKLCTHGLTPRLRSRERIEVGISHVAVLTNLTS